MKGIMIQGTASDVGKSYITTAICRLLSNKGYNVAPFKSQNMSNNSYVTIDSLEMGRAQGAQAEAARVIPRVYMNPILLKPSMKNGVEVVLNGKVFKSINGFDYSKKFTLTKGLEEVSKALEIHQDNHDVIVIEGAGSPAEVNLNDREIVNMRIANLADVNVVLVVDIDRGGSFASVVGTLELLFENKHRVKGIIINKFRGDVDRFQDGIKWLEEYTGVKVLGVIPYMEDIYIETEDAQSEMLFKKKENSLDIGVIKLQRISNNTDIEPFRFEEDVNIRLIESLDDFGNPDALIIPGTKSTIDDLKVLRDKKLGKRIKDFISNGGYVIGVCGGYQMLGKKIIDKDNVDNFESNTYDGLGVFEINTLFEPNKNVRQVAGNTVNTNTKVSGYEIHLGITEYLTKNGYFAKLEDGTMDGSTVNNGQVIGTYLHNIFHNDHFRNHWLNEIRVQKGKNKRSTIDTTSKKEESFNKLADVFEDSIDMSYFMKLL